MCVKMWREMMGQLPLAFCSQKVRHGQRADDSAGWAHRQTLLTFCTATVNTSIEAKRPQSASRLEERLEAVPSRAEAEVRQRGIKEEEVYVRPALPNV